MVSTVQCLKFFLRDDWIMASVLESENPNLGSGYERESIKSKEEEGFSSKCKQRLTIDLANSTL